MTSKTPGTGTPTPRGTPPSPSATAFLDSAPTEGETPDGQHLSPSGPVRPSGDLLSELEERFCQEYLIDLIGSKAYKRVRPDVTDASARSESARLFANPNIGKRIQELMDERAIATGVTSDRIVMRLWQMATADPRELVEVRINGCRHCWGLYFQYQYTDTELERLEHDHIHAEARRRKREGEKFEPRDFPRKGGGGFDATRRPNPDCPECGGQGAPQHVVKDTRDLSPGAAMLYGGVKLGKDGSIAMVVRDQLPALKLVGEHLGMWNDKLPPQSANPLQDLLRQLQGASGSAAALPIVREDPELVQHRRPADPDIEDVPVKRASGALSAPAAPQPKPGKGWRAA